MSLILSIKNSKAEFTSALHKQRVLNPDDPSEDYCLKEFQMFLDMLVAHDFSLDELKELRKDAKLLRD